MSLLVYGIAEADSDGPTGDGLGGRRLRCVADGSLLAVVSEHDGADPEPTAAVLRTYESTIRRLMGRGAILPARFGSVLEDEAAVRALLRRRREDLVSRLRQVHGAVEIGLRASWREGVRARPNAGAQSGTSYLRDRLELRQRARQVAGELDPLTAIARCAHRALAPRPDLPVLDAYLVDQERMGEFVALVEQLDGRLDDVELVCTGPWPPYSFAESAPA
jgi:hypothetical protein